jgi:glycosylphosphatidylinositol transamidase
VRNLNFLLFLSTPGKTVYYSISKPPRCCHRKSRQPHSSALNHGIDALTIEVRVPGNRDSHPASIHPHYADLTRCTEHLLRSISNLHERLHHSIAQYTMPSPSKFVSHGEYIYPAILVSLPMVVRAVTLALRDLKRFQFVHVGVVLATVCMASFAVGVLAMSTNTRRSGKDFTSEFIMPIAFIVSYVLVHFAARQDRLRIKKVVDETEIQGSLRFTACLVGIYLHAPLLLANYSLGFPSSAFWSPLLATLVLPPSIHASLSASKVLSPLAAAVKGIFLLMTTPPILLVPRIFHSYTFYVCCVYTPLHFLLAVLWLA